MGDDLLNATLKVPGGDASFLGSKRSQSWLERMNSSAKRLEELCAIDHSLLAQPLGQFLTDFLENSLSETTLTILQHRITEKPGSFSLRSLKGDLETLLFSRDSVTDIPVATAALVLGNLTRFLNDPTVLPIGRGISHGFSDFPQSTAQVDPFIADRMEEKVSCNAGISASSPSVALDRYRERLCSTEIIPQGERELLEKIVNATVRRPEISSRDLMQEIHVDDYKDYYEIMADEVASQREQFRHAAISSVYVPYGDGLTLVLDLTTCGENTELVTPPEGHRSIDFEKDIYGAYLAALESKLRYFSENGSSYAQLGKASMEFCKVAGISQNGEISTVNFALDAADIHPGLYYQHWQEYDIDGANPTSRSKAICARALSPIEVPAMRTLDFQEFVSIYLICGLFQGAPKLHEKKISFDGRPDKDRIVFARHDFADHAPRAVSSFREYARDIAVNTEHPHLMRERVLDSFLSDTQPLFDLCAEREILSSASIAANLEASYLFVISHEAGLWNPHRIIEKLDLIAQDESEKESRIEEVFSRSQNEHDFRQAFPEGYVPDKDECRAALEKLLHTWRRIRGMNAASFQLVA